MKYLLPRAWLLLLLPACAALSGCGQSQAPGGPPPQQAPEVSVSEPVLKKVTDYEDFPGRIESKHAVEIRARATGFLEKPHFREGAEVRKGDLLFEIDKRPYLVKLDIAKADVASARANAIRAQILFDRSSLLARKNAGAQEDVDKLKGDLDVAQAMILQAEAKLADAQLNLDYCTVTAPVTGRISRRFIDPGNMVKADETALTTIVALDPVYAYFDLDERSTLKAQRLLREGKVKWDVDHPLPLYLGLADEEGRFPRQGAIDFADNRIDPDTGTWRLRATVPNPDRTLYPGLYIRIRLPIGEPYQALLVSEQALIRDQGQQFVYVVNKANKVEYRRVRVGREHGGLRAIQPAEYKVEKGQRVIAHGLEKGERVIVNGQQRVRPGMDVVPQPVPMPVLAGSDQGPAVGSPGPGASGKSGGVKGPGPERKKARP